MLIKNPILTGFHADPCICRRGDDYYIAVSSFEWFPGIPIYHSRDMKHWELYTHVLTDERTLDLKRLPSAKGIWAPCLTYCEAEGLFYVVYGIMNSMNARYFDIDNYLITAPDITGPWSEPVYLHSAGFDASLLHGDDGRKWLVSLDWEFRTGYEKPGAICLVEYDPKAKAIKGNPQRIWRGGTDRGCLEAPHLTKRNGWYYLMCAEGGTGYYHCVTMAREGSVRSLRGRSDKSDPDRCAGEQERTGGRRSPQATLLQPRELPAEVRPRQLCEQPQRRDLACPPLCPALYAGAAVHLGPRDSDPENDMD